MREPLRCYNQFKGEIKTPHIKSVEIREKVDTKLASSAVEVEREEEWKFEGNLEV